MSQINQGLIRTVLTKGKAALKSTVTNDSRFADQLGIIKRWIANKQQQSIITDELVMPLFNNAETLGDESEISYKNYDTEEDALFLKSVDNNIVDDILAGYDTAASRWNDVYHDDMYANGFTLSDAQGYCYNFIKGDYNIKLVDGTVKRVHGLAMVTDPHDYHDMFIFTVEDTGESFVNPIVKSVGYFRETGNFHSINTIRESLNEIADLIDMDEYATTDLEYINLMTGENDDNIFDATVSLCNKYNLTPGDTIFGNLQVVLQYVRSTWVQVNTGIKKYIGDIYRAIAVNSTILEVYNYVTEGLFSNKMNDVISNLRYKFSEVASSAKTVINNISDAFAVGGFYGVVSYLISVIKGEGSIQRTGEQLQFTDSSSLAPAQYIAGIIMTAIGTVAQAAAIIVTSLSRIAGGLLAIAGSILLAIPKAFNYDYSTNTLAAVNDGDQFIIDCCPHATFQYEFTASNQESMFDCQLYALITANAAPVYCQVPGGYLFFGKGSTDNSIRCEFHASSRCVRFRNMSELFEVYDAIQAWSSKRSMNWKVNKYSLNPKALATAWAQDYEYYSEVLQNADNGLLNLANDARLRQVVVGNTSVFYVYLMLIAKAYPDDILGQVISVPWSTGGQGTTPPSADFSLGPNTMLQWFLHACMYPNTWFWTDGPLCTWTELAELFASNNTSVSMITWAGHLASESQFHEYLPGTSFEVSYYPLRTIILMIRDEDFVYGDILALPNFYVYYFSTPKYERSSFWGWVILATFVTVVAAVAVAVTTIKVKKAIQNKRAKLTSQVSNDWETYTKSLKEYDPNDPDDRPEYHTAQAQKDAYQNYFKSVKKNNRWQMILGGTKYSTAGYWDSDSTTEPDDEEGNSIFTSVKDCVDCETDEFNSKEDTPNDYANNLKIYEAVTGKLL